MTKGYLLYHVIGFSNITPHLFFVAFFMTHLRYEPNSLPLTVRLL